MNLKILLASFSFMGLLSCSSAFKVTQTPDDVYYSPAREITSDDEVKKDENKYDDNNYGYQQWDDRRLKMRCQSRYNKWNTFDDYSWNTSSYSNYDWRFDIWTNTWYPVSNCSCSSNYYYYWPKTYVYTKPVYVYSPKPTNTNWLNTNYNSSNYNNPKNPKNSYYNQGSNGVEKPKNRASDGRPKRSFSIPLTSSGSTPSSSPSSGSSSGNGRAFRK